MFQTCNDTIHTQPGKLTKVAGFLFVCLFIRITVTVTRGQRPLGVVLPMVLRRSAGNKMTEKSVCAQFPQQILG